MLLVLFRDGLLLFSVLVRLLKIFFFLWLCAPSGDVVAPGVLLALLDGAGDFAEVVCRPASHRSCA